MYDFLIDVANNIVKHGLSVTTLLGAVFLLLKNPKIKLLIKKSVKKTIKKWYPFLFNSDSEIKPYVENQRIIMANQKLIMERMGIECADTSKVYSKSETSQPKKQRGQSQLLVTTFSIVRYAKKLMKFGGKKMKNYLKKLGSRKFQSLLLSLIINAVSAYLFFSGTVEIDAVLDAYMPMINLIVGTVSTWLYIWVEGKIDAAQKIDQPSEAINFLQEE